MKLKITAIITAAVLLIFTSLTAHAAVYTVEKPTNGNTIYMEHSMNRPTINDGIYRTNMFIWDIP